MGLVDKTCRHDEYGTPEIVLDCVRKYYGGDIPLDPCTSDRNNVKAKRYLTKDMDGLSVLWDVGSFVNPPYGKKLRAWVHKIGDEARRGSEVIALLPSNRFETKYLQEDLFVDELIGVCFVKGRLKFSLGGAEGGCGNPWGSVLYGFNVHWKTFKESFQSLGRCIEFIF